jgi:hypothetical protein
MRHLQACCMIGGSRQLCYTEALLLATHKALLKRVMMIT